MKISWRWTFIQIFRNLDVQKIWSNFEYVKYSICSSLGFEYRLLVIFTQERAPEQTFNYLKSTLNKNTEQKCENYSKLTITTPERLSSLLIVNFGHNLLFFWTSKCLLALTLSIYKRWNKILLHLLTDVQKTLWNNK